MNHRREIVIYISGAYTGNDEGKSIDSNIKLAREAAIELWERGYTVICPHLNTINFEKDCKLQYYEYLDGDCIIIERCDGVFMLENWKNSLGAVTEHGHAEIYSKPIFYKMEEVEEWYENQIN